MMQPEASSRAVGRPIGERRRYGRAAVNRLLLYRTEPHGLLQGGRLTSLSHSGASIALKEPLAAGTQLWIEIPATSPAGSAFVTPADVVWVHPGDGRPCVAGIAFERRPVPNVAPVRGHETTRPAQLPSPRPPGKPALPISPKHRSKSALAAGTFVLLFALLVVLLALLWPQVALPGSTPRRIPEARLESRAINLDHLQLAVDEDSPEPLPPTMPGSRYGLGSSTPRSSSIGAGVVLVAKAGPAGDVSEVAPFAVPASSAKVPTLAGVLPTGAPPMEGRAGVRAVPVTGSGPMASESPLGTVAGGADLIRLEVHTDEFLVWVLRGDEIVHAYPIGIGQQDSTPRGTYYIANKLEQPAWFNRGDPVSPGDPRNPIGDYWMGLGDANGATQYGFHPTSDPAVGGSRRSEGCIRLRPEDAAALFELCEVGTQVVVI
ncbi:MAG: L,D-transpeptidase family protein [Candidatus Hydrogenedentes bacterium]|nr:L,D-transpeptidase family protein [Candidatus Hydrogenedentota bacterium]